MPGLKLEADIADFIRIENNPLPEGAEAFDFRSSDGGLLRAALFTRPDARAGAVVLGGRAEFIEKYFETARELQARGFSVAALDWRGQGLSERLLPDRSKGHILDFATFRADLRKFTDDVVRKKFRGPLILVAHSMGGAPSLQMLADGYGAFAGAVLSAPMTRLFSAPVKRAAIGMLARAACFFGAAQRPIPSGKEHSMTFEGNALTSDPDRHARFRALQLAAPNAIIREPTYGWLKAANDALDDLHAPDRFSRLATPILIVSAGLEQIVDGSDHAWIAAQSPLIQQTVIEGALHEIMMERDELRAAYWRAFDAFVEPLIAPR